MGFDTPTLMLAEEEYEAPFDYEGQVHYYVYTRECVQLAREWVETLAFRGVEWTRPRKLLEIP